MHVGIVGSRGYPAIERVAPFVRGIAAKHRGSTIVSGGAKGVDLAAENAARLSGLGVLSFRPVTLGQSGFGVEVIQYVQDGLPQPAPYYLFDGDELLTFPTYGRAAFARNRNIVESSDVVVAFWDGESRGTESSILLADRLGKTLFVYGRDGVRLTDGELSARLGHGVGSLRGLS